MKHDYFTAQALEKIDRMRGMNMRRDRARRRTVAALGDRVAELEDDVGRMSLLVCMLMRLGFEKNAFTPAEVQAQLEALDALDGEADGKLDPAWMKNESDEEPPPEPPAAPTPRRRRSARDRRS
jgi:hypothetical protein